MARQRHQSRSDPHPSIVDPGANDAARPPGIGPGIRHERKRQGLTLAELAGRADLTVSALSQVERGVSDPSINSLRRIAGALGIPMFQLLLEAEPADIVVRRGERSHISFRDRNIEYELVSADTRGEFEVLSLTLRPGGNSSKASGSHSSEECSLVLSGEVVAVVGEAEYLLRAGDSIKIHREVPHRFYNQSDAEATILMVISPPTF